MHGKLNWPNIDTPFFETRYALDSLFKVAVEKEDWAYIDRTFSKHCEESGSFFKLCQTYYPQIKNIEFILSIRDSRNEYEEDGVWHDDGSRELAFSLGLNYSNHIEGGSLLMRKKHRDRSTEKTYTLPPPMAQSCYFFKTGVQGHEHKVCAVTKGKRIVLAGWCT